MHINRKNQWINFAFGFITFKYLSCKNPVKIYNKV